MPLRHYLKALNKKWGKTFQISDHKRTCPGGFVTTARILYEGGTVLSSRLQNAGAVAQKFVTELMRAQQWCTWPWWVRIFGPSCTRGRGCSTSWRTPPVDPSGDPVRKRRQPEENCEVLIWHLSLAHFWAHLTECESYIPVCLMNYLFCLIIMCTKPLVHGYTTQISSWPKKIWGLTRGFQNDIIYPFKGWIYQVNKLKAQTKGRSGPTGGQICPQAVRCELACLV